MKTSESLTGHLSILLLCLILMVPACGPKVKIKHQPVQFSEAPSPHGKDKYPNWQVPPGVMEGKLARLIYERHTSDLRVKRTARGTSGAHEDKVFVPDLGKDIKFKFKRAIPGTLDSFNTSPRRELAAYKVQKLFLEPEDYVVPTSIMYCVPREIYRQFNPDYPPNVEGTNCMLGLISIWLVDVTIPEVLYDETRFLKEPNYAYFLSNLNILTYLIAHRDAREGNFLVSKDEQRRQVFSIDNGMSFGSWPRNYFSQNWDVIVVPALRKDSVDRLRQLQRQDLNVLGVVVQLEKDDKGILKPVSPSDNLDPKIGVRIQGGTVQLGLKKSEIDDVWERIVSLIADVDSGKIPVF
jgi:hypothetical protein